VIFDHDFVPGLREGHGVALDANGVVDVMEVCLLLRPLHGRALVIDTLECSLLVIDTVQNFRVNFFHRNLH